MKICRKKYFNSLNLWGLKRFVIFNIGPVIRLLVSIGISLRRLVLEIRRRGLEELLKI